MLRSIAHQVVRFMDSESGTTAIEYALIAVGLSVVIVTVVATLGQNVLNLWTTVSNSTG